MYIYPRCLQVYDAKIFMAMQICETNNKQKIILETSFVKHNAKTFY